MRPFCPARGPRQGIPPPTMTRSRRAYCGWSEFSRLPFLILANVGDHFLLFGFDSDNYRLDEWLAYHYYLMKLRYVVINIDQKSRTSPQAIIDRWNDAENKYNLNMKIVTMTDPEYIPNYQSHLHNLQKQEKLMLAKNDTSSNEAATYGRMKTQYHRMRQPEFYKACSHHLIEHNKSWTSFWDTDEFITFQQKTEIDKVLVDVAEESTQKMEEPGYILQRLNYIKKHANETGVSCEAVNRRRYCAKDLSASEANTFFASRSVMPKGLVIPGGSGTNEDQRINFRRFDTLRYNYLTPGLDGNPKSLIDLSQQSTKAFKGPWKVHKPMQTLCNTEAWHGRGEEAKRMMRDERFILNHYLGDWPSYSFRDDARRGGLRSYDVWSERANMTQGEFTHVIWPWLAGFVDLVGKGAGGGPEVASYLLQDAGRFPEGFDPWANINSYKKTYKYN